MPILRQVMGKVPSVPKSRTRNFIANRTLETVQSDVHENVLSPGATIPWHLHGTEEVIVVLDGQGECLTDAGVEAYRGGDVIIVPARTRHSLRNVGTGFLRQLCIFPDDPKTERLEAEYPGQTAETYNASDSFEAR